MACLVAECFRLAELFISPVGSSTYTCPSSFERLIAMDTAQECEPGDEHQGVIYETSHVPGLNRAAQLAELYS